MSKNLEIPKGPSDYIDGFFLGDYRTKDAKKYTDWISPGDQASLTVSGTKATRDPGTPEEIAKARGDWDKNTKEENWESRLHQECLPDFRRESTTYPKVWLYYFSGLSKDQNQAFLEATSVKASGLVYVGRTFSAAKARVEAMFPIGKVWEEFFPGRAPHIPKGKPHVVILGWERSFNS